MTDRGRDTSHELTEVRTVHTRATAALERIGYATLNGQDRPDPDADQMRAALQQTIALLDPWARTGRTRKANR